MICHSHSIINSTTNSPNLKEKSSKLTRSEEFKKLPKLNDQNAPSNRDKNFITDTNDSNSKNNPAIYNLMYTKLIELKILTEKNISGSKKKEALPTLSECLLNIFDFIANNYDIKFKKVVEIINKINESDKEKYLEVKSRQLELDNCKNELINKELQIKNLIIENEKFTKEKEGIENLFGIIKKKYQSAKQNLNNITEENKSFKNIVKDCKAEIEFLREKELKMMKVMYLLQKKGIPIDDIINENFTVNDSVNSQVSDSQNQSMMTVYFPDKINIKNNKYPSNKYKVDVPLLDFSSIPAYESNSSCEKDNKKGDSDQLNFENISEGDSLKPKQFNNSQKLNQNNCAYLNQNAKVKHSNQNNQSINNFQEKKSKNYKSELMEKYNENDD
jgi:hypothetical protein